MKIKNTIALTIANAIIEKSRQIVGERGGSKGKRTSSKSTAVNFELIQEIFSATPRPFGCQTESVAKLIEGITGVRPKLSEPAKPVQQFDVVIANSDALAGLPCIVLAVPNVVWLPGSGADTYSLDQSKHLPATRAQAEALYKQILKNPSEFLSAAKSRININELGLI